MNVKFFECASANEPIDQTAFFRYCAQTKREGIYGSFLNMALSILILGFGGVLIVRVLTESGLSIRKTAEHAVSAGALRGDSSRKRAVVRFLAPLWRVSAVGVFAAGFILQKAKPGRPPRRCAIPDSVGCKALYRAFPAWLCRLSGSHRRCFWCFFRSMSG